jgi:hypothetical protein
MQVVIGEGGAPLLLLGGSRGGISDDAGDLISFGFISFSDSALCFP